jgi:hypothetical protein
MTLDDLIDYVMTESGEFIIGDIETTLIDRHRFHLIVKRALSLYGKYRPLTERTTILVSGTADLSHGGANRPPEWVSRVIPIGSGGTNSATNQSAASFIYGSVGMGRYSNIYPTEPPRNIPWEYNKPTLSIGGGSEDMYDVTAHYNYELIDIVKDDQNKVQTAVVAGISFNDELFFDLIVGYFLIALGRSRRAFTLNDLPVTMDGGELVSEGDEKVRTTRELLQEQSSWQLAIGE